MGKIIAIAMPKGGVGKTTTAINLAANLAIAGKRTLLVDMDPMGSCNIGLGVSTDTLEGGLFELLSYIRSIDQVTCPTSIDNLWLIPSILHDPLSEERLSKLSQNTMYLRNSIRSVIFNYDFVILDCPPYLRGLTTSALLAADSVILPIKPEMFSLNAASKIVDHIGWVRKNGNSLLKIEGILLTMFESRTKASSLMQDRIMEKFSRYLFKTVIPKNTTLIEATFKGLPVMMLNAVSSGAKAYWNLAVEIAGRSERHE